jgi:hypothetical protein
MHKNRSALSQAARREKAQSTFADRFWRRVVKGDDCWEWTGSKDTNGYGRVYSPFTRTHRRTSRVAYELAIGPVPEGLEIRHKCDNRPCCRPEHLQVGTHAENIADKAGKGRRAGIVRGVRNGLAKLTDEQVLEIRRAYAAGEANQYGLARRFGVRQPLISKVLNRQIWTHI